jgi:mono/diheme cytochrome c family protein
MSQRSVTMGGVVVWSLVLTLGLMARGEQTTPREVAAKLKNPVATSAASVATGQQLFQKYCRFCHGATGRGDNPKAPKDMTPSNLTDATWDRGSTDGEIYTVIQEGAGPEFKMKGLKGKIADQDAWHIVNYVRSLSSVQK